MTKIVRGPLQPTTIIYEDTSGDGIIDACITDEDGAGLSFMGLARSPDPKNNNITIVDLFKSNPDGSFNHNPDVSYAYQHKIDHIKVRVVRKTSLQFYADTHWTSGGLGDDVEGYVWEGVWTPVAAGGAPQVQETCVPPLNRPNFRPNNNFTRGQACKMIAIAADLPLPTDGRQSFQDVPPDNTFYPYIEAVHEKGAIGGYPCKP